MDLSGSRNGNILPGRGLMNPAFVIKIVAATDDMQQPKGKPRKNSNDDYLSNLSAGDDVDFTKNGKDISGTVQRLIKNSLGDVTYVVVADHYGKTHKVESTLIQHRNKLQKNDDDESRVSSPAMFNESRFLSFLQYTNTSV